ncbi:copper transporter [Rhodococcus sp. X156]|uniref:copper transporter n=1 Tax=Rhodococcus sp. X156 TaxID=2499145 RepID=UPI0013E3BF5A|nr:copper transporter [Rhodococcus sp. X156]
MITLRHHIISIAAVFLALALGLVLGSTSVSNGLLSGLRDDKSGLQQNVRALETERNALREQLNAANGFDTAVAPLALRSVLTQRSVVIFTAPDASSADRDALVRLIADAGGSVAGQVALTPAFVNPANADQVRSTITNVIPAGVQLPTGSVDSGSLAGSLLGSVLLLDATTAKPRTTPAELAVAVQALQAAGFVGNGGPTPTAGQLGLVLTGGAITGDGAGDRASTIARFAAALDRSSAGVVLAGRTGSAEGNGPLGVARADVDVTAALTTVDNVDTAAGQITAVLGLQEQLDGRAGRYGTAGNAQGMTVPTQG